MPNQPSRLAVLGSPIAHSKSPLLHAAAYAVLGLDWQYGRVEMDGGGLSEFIETRDSGWRGLSLTMPLKRDILPLLDVIDPLVTLTGAANTVLFEPEDAESAERTVHGFNTDVYGVTQALREAGVGDPTVVHLLGAGATAASVVVAVIELGARKIVVLARSPEKATPLVTVGEQLGVEVVVRPLGDSDAMMGTPDLVASTLPGGTVLEHPFTERTRASAALFDVAYDPWPSLLASQWESTVVSGLDMLVHQALAQVRIFLAGSPLAVLPNEPAVLAAMRAALA
ncbi:MAG: shikimate dehydrogenase family protein [Microbacteriaceae bacterium]